MNNQSDDNLEKVGADFVSLLVRFLVISWNMFMKILLFMRVMPLFRRTPSLFLVLGFLLLAFVFPVGVYFAAAALVGFDSKNTDNDFIQNKKPNKRPDFATDDEEREAMQGEAALRVIEAGHSIEKASIVYEAIGELYDMKKNKGEIGGRDGKENADANSNSASR